MIVAVPYDAGHIFQHFGKAKEFKFYTIQGSHIISSQISATAGAGHGAVIAFLQAHGTTEVICGGIGAGAQQGLQAVHIVLHAGITMAADEAVTALLQGTLTDGIASCCDKH